jgi:hypothetical protein
MSSGNGLFARFQLWLENEAREDPNLEKPLQEIASDQSGAALIAYVRLFLTFVLRGATSRAAIPREELAEKTTDDIARDVLQQMKSTRRERQQTLTEVSRPTPVEAKPSQAALEPIAQPRAEERAAAPIDQDKEFFLKQMQEEIARRDKEYDEETKRLRKQEDVVFKGSLMAAILTLAVVLIGIALIFLNLAALGIVSGAAGLLPGAGSVILSRLAKEARTERQRISDRREDNLKVLQAIQATLLIPDPARRSEAIAALSAQLADRALKSKP